MADKFKMEEEVARLLGQLLKPGSAVSPAPEPAVRNLCDAIDLSSGNVATEPATARAGPEEDTQGDANPSKPKPGDAPRSKPNTPSNTPGAEPKPPAPSRPAAHASDSGSGSEQGRTEGDGDSGSDLDSDSDRSEQDSDRSECPSDPEELADRTVELEARLGRARSAWGDEDERTLSVLFKVLDALVAQYELNRMDKLFEEFFDICAKVRGKWYLKAIQSRAFCCFKQYRFREALQLFKEQEALMGPSAPLCENIGHVCSSLSEYDDAERYFRLATRLLPGGRRNSKNSGGVYLGLGLLLDRRDRTREALPVLYQSLEQYKESCYLTGKFVESSLVAKAHMSIGHAHERVDELAQAEENMRSAVGIFERTVGYSSPLVAGALFALGKVRNKQEALVDASVHLARALGLEVIKDAFHIRTVWEVLEEIKAVHEKELMRMPTHTAADLVSTFGPHERVIGKLLGRVEAMQLDAKEPDTTAVLRKTCGEMLLLGGHDEQAETQLQAAVRMLRGFSHCDCSRLVAQCDDLLVVAAERLRPRREQG
eukprot:CAMPEP_0179858338 /NCGR_PEP_ID=MMETSP0982-20121206/12328_1 /TAXON_ID=483367 /ORGANISM="non described non described, Strain CCMP 2436" /LENGTH=540 /DNA_ID=CAMNT_0021745113 /DNA_START=1410 /DNA_END=3029 /DNA_ORIENTATION=-